VYFVPNADVGRLAARVERDLAIYCTIPTGRSSAKRSVHEPNKCNAKPGVWGGGANLSQNELLET